MSTTLKWLLVIFVLLILGGGGIYIYQNYYQKGKVTTPSAPTATTPTKKEFVGGIGGGPGLVAEIQQAATIGWQTYKIAPAEEEAAEPRQAVGFSINYKDNWSHKIFDDEIRAQAAPVYKLHFVAFSKNPLLNVSYEKVAPAENTIIVYADSHLFKDLREIEEGTFGGKKGTETQLATGERVVKFVGQKQSPAGTSEEEYVTVLVEPLADWTLVIEGAKTDEGTIDQMVQSLQFPTL